MALAPISPSGVSTPFIYPRDTAGGPGIQDFIGADPGPVNAPIIFEPDCALTGNNLEIWMVVSGASPHWGGADVWGSTDPAGNFGLLGQVSRGTQGVLSANFASGTDPDTADTLSVDLTESLGTLMAGTAADADTHITLCYCDGELLAYSAATLTSAYHYALGTYMRRGLYKTAITSHAAGSPFARLTPAIFRQGYPESLVGTTLYFKFTSFNGMGLHEQDLAAVTAYPYTLTGLGLCPTSVVTGPLPAVHFSAEPILTISLCPTEPTDGQVPVWDAMAGEWCPADQTGGGGGPDDDTWDMQIVSSGTSV